MDRGGQHYALVTLPEVKQPQIPTEQEVGGPKRWSGHFGTDNIYCAC